MNRRRHDSPLGMPRVERPTEDETRELIRRAQADDVEARNECVTRNMPLVIQLTRKHARRWDYPDIVQEGALGLMRAIEDFDLATGYKFSTYAVHWIGQRVKRYFQESCSVIRVPAHIQGDSKARDERAARSKEDARAVAELEADRDRVFGGISSLAGDEGLSVRDDAHERLEVAELAARVSRRMQLWLDRDAAVFRRRFGLEGVPWGTLTQVGLEHGITRERVRQIERYRLKELQEMFDASEST